VSVRSTLRASPTLLRVGFAGALAYRAEMIVWVLATTMPLVMLALWTSVADGGPVGRYGRPQFIAYFLATFVVRQLTGCWVFWEMTFEVRSGTLAMRLLRPIHPLWAYAFESVAATPMRLVVCIPAALATLLIVGRSGVTHEPMMWIAWLASIAGAWVLTLLVNFIVGSASFFVESSLKLMDLWLVFYFVLSGYLVPVDLFPASLRHVIDWLPFRFQIGLPVEIMTGAHSARECLVLLARQWSWVLAALLATATTWRFGLKRFAAYGG
jgi:ABC-2 type transport system permease protein